MQISRLFEIIYILLDKKSVTARELSEHFCVSRRTICRDVDTLSMSGVPIYTERGKGGGISLLPNFVLNKSILNEQEQNEILSALYALSNIKTDDTNQVLQKLSTIFSKPVTNWLEVDFSGWGHENDFFNDFKTAILEQRVVLFDYFNSHGEKSRRRVEPIRVWFKSKAWYLKGFCLDKQAMRLYKLSRIKNFVVTNEVFAARSLPDYDPFANDCDKQKSTLLKLCIQPQMAHQMFDIFHEGMVEKQPDGSFVATVSWPEDNWLYGMILSFGEYIEVLEPEHIKEKIKNTAQEIFKKYL